MRSPTILHRIITLAKSEWREVAARPWHVLLIEAVAAALLSRLLTRREPRRFTITPLVTAVAAPVVFCLALALATILRLSNLIHSLAWQSLDALFGLLLSPAVAV